MLTDFSLTTFLKYHSQSVLLVGAATYVGPCVTLIHFQTTSCSRVKRVWLWSYVKHVL